MVWKESGKFGVHTGRTLRKTSWSSSLQRDRGFLIKNVTNPSTNFTDDDIRRCLQKFQVQDGLNDEDVVKESRNNRNWHFGGGGFQDNSVLYSLGKRKRWLVPEVLREQIPEDYDGENDYKVVLVERVSMNDSPFYFRSPRLKRGDCSAVLDGEEVRKPKRRKFAHVGDLRSNSNKTEIFYEVNHTEPATSWPSYLQNDWRESRDQNKAKCKQKGKKNKRRLWGEFSKYELDRVSYEFKRNGMLDRDMRSTNRREKEPALSVDSFEHCSRLMSEETDSVHVKNFDIGNYICEVLTATSACGSRKNSKKHVKIQAHDDRTHTTVNSASSQLIYRLEKGSAVHIDSIDSLSDGYHDNTLIDTSRAGVTTPTCITEKTAGGVHVIHHKTDALDVDIASEKLHPCSLQAQFGEIYKESGSMPRRFCINCPTDQSTNFVFTCQPKGAYQNVDAKIERVSVTVVSDSVHSKNSLGTKDFLSNFFGFLVPGSRAEKEPPPGAILDQGQNICDDNPCCRLAVMPFDLLCDVNRWTYKASVPSLAIQGGLSSNILCSETITDKESKVLILPETVVCEICCCEFYHDTSDETRPVEFSCTAMKSCSHWFCNECWRAYLTAQLQHGKTVVKCPAYDCDTPVDDVTLMGLVPDKFHKFQTMRQEKAIEVNTEWKWCPGDKCDLVVKVTSLKDTKGELDPVPICCQCGHKWCFACQEEPHWPASCAEAAFFRSQTETYEKLIRSKTGGITSVNVKRCPHCHYPIEKNKGCPHMSCIMCKGEFCWTCLGNWASHRWGADCSNSMKQEEEVELVNHIGSTRFNKHLRVAIMNRVARAGPILYQKYSAVKKLEGVLQSYDELSESSFCTAKGFMPSATFLLLNLYSSHEVPKYLKASADFKFQAHFVVEGVSILMAVSKTKSCHVKLRRLVSTLLFVADRLEDIANSRKLYSEWDKMHFKKLMKAGKQCIDCIRKLCIKAHQH